MTTNNSAESDTLNGKAPVNVLNLGGRNVLVDVLQRYRGKPHAHFVGRIATGKVFLLKNKNQTITISQRRGGNTKLKIWEMDETEKPEEKKPAFNKFTID